MPVSGSISTSQMCVPLGQLGPSVWPSLSTESRAPSSFLAISNRLTCLSVPTTVRVPSRYSISSMDVSSICDAFSRAFAIKSTADTTEADRKIGIALHHIDLVDGDAERFRDHL